MLRAQPVQLLGQFLAVGAKGVFAVKRRVFIHAQHGGGVGPGRKILQNGDALVHLQKAVDPGLVLQPEILAQKRRAVLRVGLGQQVEVAFARRGSRRGLVHGPAHPRGQPRSQPHGQNGRQKPGQQHGVRRCGRAVQHAAGQRHAQVASGLAKQHIKHIHQRHRPAGAGQRRGQRRVGAQVRRPHDGGVRRQPRQIDAAKVLEGVDEAPAKDHAVELERLGKNAAHRQAGALDGIAQHDDHHQRHSQRHGERQVQRRRALHGRAALAQQRKRRKAQRHEPDVQKPVHDDGGQRKADAGFHAAAHIDGAQHVAQVQRQQRVDGVAAGHAAQHDAALRALIDAHELLPPQQAERMPRQHQGDGKQDQQRHSRASFRRV